VWGGRGQPSLGLPRQPCVRPCADTHTHTQPPHTHTGTVRVAGPGRARGPTCWPPAVTTCASGAWPTLASCSTDCSQTWGGREHAWPHLWPAGGWQTLACTHLPSSHPPRTALPSATSRTDARLLTPPPPAACAAPCRARLARTPRHSRHLTGTRPTPSAWARAASTRPQRYGWVGGGIGGFLICLPACLSACASRLALIHAYNLLPAARTADTPKTHTPTHTPCKRTEIHMHTCPAPRFPPRPPWWCVQDIERGVVDTQLIAHDREVYDIAWGGVGVFATVSADGSVRVFDLR
jgi:hypothetical protein